MRVIIAGGGVAALETVLGLHELAGERVSVSVLAPNQEFVYRPMTVREPFAYAPAARYELAPILAHAGAELVPDTLGWVDTQGQVVNTGGGETLEYDALVLALGAQARPRYEHAITIDDRRLDAELHGLIQDIEGGYLKQIAKHEKELAKGIKPDLPFKETLMITVEHAQPGEAEAVQRLARELAKQQGAHVGVLQWGQGVLATSAGKPVMQVSGAAGFLPSTHQVEEVVHDVAEGAKAGGGVALHAETGALKAGAKLLGEKAAKAIPFVGVAVGGILVTQDVRAGDWGAATWDTLEAIPVVGDYVMVGHLALTLGRFEAAAVEDSPGIAHRPPL